MSITTTYSTDIYGPRWEITGNTDPTDIEDAIKTLLSLQPGVVAGEVKWLKAEVERLNTTLTRANERCTNYAKRLDTAFAALNRSAVE